MHLVSRERSTFVFVCVCADLGIASIKTPLGSGLGQGTAVLGYVFFPFVREKVRACKVERAEKFIFS